MKKEHETRQTPVFTPIAGALGELNPTLFLLLTGGLMTALSLLGAMNFLVHEQDAACRALVHPA
jgi:hypothetical protein